LAYSEFSGKVRGHLVAQSVEQACDLGPRACKFKLQFGCRDYLKIFKEKKRNFVANMFLVVIPTRGLLQKMF